MKKEIKLKKKKKSRSTPQSNLSGKYPSNSFHEKIAEQYKL